MKDSNENEVSRVQAFKKPALPLMARTGFFRQLISGVGFFRQPKITDTRHTYDYEVDTSSCTAPAKVIRMVGKNKRVLEVGCGPGSITRVLSKEGGCQVTGLELDSKAINLVKQYCVELIEADLNSPDWPKLLHTAEKFDVVLAADVLEHLYDPWETLKRMSTLINANGYLVVSIPHVGHAAVISCLINSDFEYRDWGLLDRTHIRFFGLKNIEDLFARAKLKIIEVQYVTKSPEKTEFFESWSMLPLAIQKALMSREHAKVYQVVVRAVPISFPGDVVSLTSSRCTLQHTFLERVVLWKYQIAPRLSPEAKQFIRKAFSLIRINF